MAGLGGRGDWWSGGGGVVCRQPDPWEVRREEVIGILVEAKKEGGIRKRSVLSTVGSTDVLSLMPPLSINGRG